MNWFWKHKKTGAVIHPVDYANLTDEHKSSFHQTEEQPTHQVEDEEDDGTPILTALLVGEALAEVSESSDSGGSASVGDSPSDTNFQGFGGGDGGGGGAGGDFGSSSDSSSSDSGSSDSGSSDSGSSDSGGGI